MFSRSLENYYLHSWILSNMYFSFEQQRKYVLQFHINLFSPTGEAIFIKMISSCYHNEGSSLTLNNWQSWIARKILNVQKLQNFKLNSSPLSTFLQVSTCLSHIYIFAKEIKTLLYIPIIILINNNARNYSNVYF